MFEKLQTGEKSDSLEPAAIRFMLEHLQEPAMRSGYFLPALWMLHPMYISYIVCYSNVLVMHAIICGV